MQMCQRMDLERTYFGACPGFAVRYDMGYLKEKYAIRGYIKGPRGAEGSLVQWVSSLTPRTSSYLLFVPGERR